MNNNDYGRIPPQDQDIERAILGAIIKSPESLEKVIELISEETFYSESNMIIFSCIYELFKEGKQVDLLTVTNRLRKIDKIDRIDGTL